MASCCRSDGRNNIESTRQLRRRTEMSQLRSSTRSLLITLVVAALFAVSTVSVSAFNALRSPCRGTTTTTTDVFRYNSNYQRIGTTERGGRLSATIAATAPKRWRATTPLFASPTDNNNYDDDNEGLTTPSSSSSSSSSSPSTTSLRNRLHSWKCWIQFWKNSTVQNLLSRGQQQQRPEPSPGSRRNNRGLARAFGATLAAGIALAGASAPVSARTLQENLEEGTVVYSLRPGVSREQAEQLSSGVMPDEVRDNIDSKTAIGATTALSKEEAAGKARQKDTLYGDCDDYDDDDYAADEEEFGDSAYGNSLAAPSRQRQKSFSNNGNNNNDNNDVSSRISKSTKSAFTGISSDAGKTKPVSLYAKVSLACFLPTFGLFGVRDFVRNRKEEQNVQKALEIVDAQRAEYFGVDKDGNNITATEEEDSDIEDELKELKDGDSDDDDDDGDDDDDDDDDDEDKPPRRRRSLPKPPKGPQGDGSGGTGGGFDDFGDDGDGDGPSDEDIARLGDIFDKS